MYTNLNSDTVKEVSAQLTEFVNKMHEAPDEYLEEYSFEDGANPRKYVKGQWAYKEFLTKEAIENLAEIFKRFAEVDGTLTAWY